jgi:hypothetical protein
MFICALLTICLWLVYAVMLMPGMQEILTRPGILGILLWTLLSPSPPASLALFVFSLIHLWKCSKMVSRDKILWTICMALGLSLAACVYFFIHWRHGDVRLAKTPSM